jgi:hypothetical protein
MTLHPYTMTVRLKGMRQSFEISYGAVYDLAVKKFVIALAAGKKGKKKARKK